MKKVTTEIFCDICNKNKYPKETIKNTELTVIFTTEQTEGLRVKPYLSNQKIDICPECLATILQGNMLFAEGAQGCNKYYFREN